MPKYTLIKAKEVGRTTVTVYKLCIDGVCIVDNDRDLIKNEGTYITEIERLYAIMEQACNLQSQPKKKYHPLKLKGVAGNVHEAKSRNLRMYALQLKEQKKAIILISKKTSQKKDLNGIIKLIKDIESQGELPIETEKQDINE